MSESLLCLGRIGWEVLAVLLLSGTPGQLQKMVPVVQLVEHGANKVIGLIPKEHAYRYNVYLV